MLSLVSLPALPANALTPRPTGWLSLAFQSHLQSPSYNLQTPSCIATSNHVLATLHPPHKDCNIWSTSSWPGTWSRHQIGANLARYPIDDEKISPLQLLEIRLRTTQTRLSQAPSRRPIITLPRPPQSTQEMARNRVADT